MAGPAGSKRPEPGALERTMRLSVAEGVCYALMAGHSEVYFLADAIRLGAGPTLQGLVVGLPLFAGTLGPLLALHRLSRGGRRRPLVAAAAGLQAVILAGLALADATGRLDPTRLILLVALYQVCGQAAGTAWSSWFGDLVPAPIRGRYFSRRTRAVHAATFLGIASAGGVLHLLEPPPGTPDALGRGFAAIFAVAALCRLASAALLFASTEGPSSGVASRIRLASFLRTPRGTEAGRLLLSLAGLQFAVYLAAAYFTPHMLEDLGFTYAEFSAASIVLVAAKVGLLPRWGLWTDRIGARRVARRALWLVALVPLPWVFAGGLPPILAAQAFSGFAWGGYEIGVFTLLLETSSRGVRPVLFAAHSLLNGFSQLLGAAMAGAVLIPLGVGHRGLFALSAAMRALSAVGFHVASRRVAAGARTAPPRIEVGVAGVRPAAGVVHRPVWDPSPTEAEPQTTRANDG